MRIRQVKPAFWSDARLATYDQATRLFYIGLWMIADDAGWLRWDPSEVARDLYGYETRGRRERRVRAMFAGLAATGRVVLYPCGHAEIPRMTVHQHLSVATKQVRTFQREHADCQGSPLIPADARENPPIPGRKGKGEGNVNGGGNGTVSDGHGKGSARPLAPVGAVALTDEDLPPHLRIVVTS